MRQTIPRPSGRIGRWGVRALLVSITTVNIIGLVLTAAAFLYADIGVDWAMYQEAGRRVTDGGLFDWPDNSIMVWRYSPVIAYLFALISPIGYLGWTLLHFGALALLPWRMALITLVSWPFWNDVYNGNTLTFVFVAAFLALRGSRSAALVFLAFTLLMPRPFMLPVAAFLLWHDRVLWLPLAGLFAGHALAVVLSGWHTEWIAELVSTSRSAGEIFGNFGPTRVFGVAWLVVGLPLAGWLTVMGRVGLAGLAMSPYILVPYYLMALLDLPRHGPDARTAQGTLHRLRARSVKSSLRRATRSTHRLIGGSRAAEGDRRGGSATAGVAREGRRRRRSTGRAGGPREAAG